MFLQVVKFVHSHHSLPLFLLLSILSYFFLIYFIYYILFFVFVFHIFYYFVIFILSHISLPLFLLSYILPYFFIKKANNHKRSLASDLTSFYSSCHSFNDTYYTFTLRIITIVIPAAVRMIPINR